MSDETARQHPKLRALLDYWRSKSEAHAVPPRSAIDPAEIPQLLPNVMLWEVLDGGRDFRVRLAGTLVEAVHGGPLTERLASELHGSSHLAEAPAHMAEVLARGEPDFASGTATKAPEGPLYYDRVLLPLGGDNGEAYVLAAFTYRRQAAGDPT